MAYKEITEKRLAINLSDPDRNVTNELLSEMIDLAARAPSSFNLQPGNLIGIARYRCQGKAQGPGLGPAQSSGGASHLHSLSGQKRLAGGLPQGGKKLAGNV